jgi:hypothetical protein
MIHWKSFVLAACALALLGACGGPSVAEGASEPAAEEALSTCQGFNALGEGDTEEGGPNTGPLRARSR